MGRPLLMDTSICISGMSKAHVQIGHAVHMAWLFRGVTVWQACARARP